MDFTKIPLVVTRVESMMTINNVSSSDATQITAVLNDVLASNQLYTDITPDIVAITKNGLFNAGDIPHLMTIILQSSIFSAIILASIKNNNIKNIPKNTFTEYSVYGVLYLLFLTNNVPDPDLTVFDLLFPGLWKLSALTFTAIESGSKVIASGCCA